jgi:hypothetical protein
MALPTPTFRIDGKLARVRSRKHACVGAAKLLGALVPGSFRRRRRDDYLIDTLQALLA